MSSAFVFLHGESVESVWGWIQKFISENAQKPAKSTGTPLKVPEIWDQPALNRTNRDLKPER
jgi:hypothetical protein